MLKTSFIFETRVRMCAVFEMRSTRYCAFFFSSSRRTRSPSRFSSAAYAAPDTNTPTNPAHAVALAGGRSPHKTPPAIVAALFALFNAMYPVAARACASQVR